MSQQSKATSDQRMGKLPLTKDGKNILYKTENFVLLVVLGLLSSSSTSSSSTSSPQGSSTSSGPATSRSNEGPPENWRKEAAGKLCGVVCASVQGVQGNLCEVSIINFRGQVWSSTICRSPTIDMLRKFSRKLDRNRVLVFMNSKRIPTY